MTQELTLFKTGAAPSTKFATANLPTQRLDDGVAAGFGRVSYKGSKWGIRFQGSYTPIQARMPDGTLIQSPFLDVVILRASGHPNKAFYEGAYVEGDNSQPPDCWSSNGAVPDAGAPKKQSATCVGCKWNVWGSKINRDTGLATKGKACMDSKRMAVVPVGDIENKLYGGPMMLSVPPSSLKRLGPYQNMLEANGFHYAAVWTRITFEAESAYPLFSFDAIAALNDQQADQVLKMIDHPLIDRILDAEVSVVEAYDESAVHVHANIYPGAQPATPASAPTPSPTPAGPTATKTETPPEDDLAIPEHLKRNPAPVQAQPETVIGIGMIPGSPAAATTAPPQPEATAAPALPPGVVLPPGMTPEMYAQFMANFQPPKAGGKGRRRTPPVSPATTDSAAVTGLAGASLPTPAGPVTNGAAAPAGADAAVGQIMSTIGKLI